MCTGCANIVLYHHLHWLRPHLHKHRNANFSKIIAFTLKSFIQQLKFDSRMGWGGSSVCCPKRSILKHTHTQKKKKRFNIRPDRSSVPTPNSNKRLLWQGWRLGPKAAFGGEWLERSSGARSAKTALHATAVSSRIQTMNNAGQSAHWPQAVCFSKPQTSTLQLHK